MVLALLAALGAWVLVTLQEKKSVYMGSDPTKTEVPDVTGIPSQPGVSWNGATPALVAGIRRAQSAVEALAPALGPFVVTSVMDGVHMAGSFHYKGLAFDLRTRHLKNSAQVNGLFELVRRALGPGWDVIIESDHIHAEIDPK